MKERNMEQQGSKYNGIANGSTRGQGHYVVICQLYQNLLKSSIFSLCHIVHHEAVTS